VCVCVAGGGGGGKIGVRVTAKPKVYSCYITKPAAPARITLVTFPLPCSYWSGTSTSLFTPPMGQRYLPPNILNTFLPHSLLFRQLMLHVSPKRRQCNPLRRSAKSLKTGSTATMNHDNWFHYNSSCFKKITVTTDFSLCMQRRHMQVDSRIHG
jgi:hypothetical protein